MRRRIRCTILLATLTAIPAVALSAAAPAQAAPKFEATPWTVTYGFVPVGTTSPSQVISIRNAGDGQLKPASIRIEGLHPNDFVVTGDACSGAVLGSGQSCAIRVAFRPTEDGTRVASIKVTDDSPCPNWITIAGSGDQRGARVTARAAACESQQGGAPNSAGTSQGGSTVAGGTTQNASSTVVRLPPTCRSRRLFSITIKRPKGKRLTKVRVTLNDREFKVVKGNKIRAKIDLRGLPRGRFRLEVVAKTSDGKTYTSTRRYTTCVSDR